MKRLFIILLCIVLLFSAVGCTSKNTQDNKLNIVTTVFPAFDFAREIAKDKANLTMLLPPASESHFYEPSLNDIAKIEDCDLFIYAGGDIDSWAEDVIDALGKEINVICMSSLVEPLHSEHSHEHGGSEGYDSHVWTSPKNAKIICNKIAENLCSVDTLNATIYSQNLSSYSQQLNSLDAQLTAIAKNKARKTLVFADRFPFAYLTSEYGFDALAAIDGCSSETEPTLTAISNIIDTVNAQNISTVFYIEFSSQKTADIVCSKTNANKKLLHSCHNLSKQELNSGENYISLMQKNIENIKEALCNGAY